MKKKELAALEKLCENTKVAIPLTLLFQPKQAKAVIELHQKASAMKKQIELFCQRFSDYGWCAYDHMKMSLIELANKKFEESGIEAAEEVLIAFYANEAKEWTNRIIYCDKAFTVREDLLRHYFDAHFAGNYYASIPLALLIIDGAVNDYTKSKGFFADGTEVDAWDCLVGCDEALAKVQSIFRKGRPKTNAAPITMPYRNGILHGRDINFANVRVACKCLMQYVRSYQEFMKENGITGVTFSRAGYAGAQTAAIHWAGDQVSDWSELRSQLTAGLSAGLSGVLYWSFDIGGFAGSIPDKELYLRATAMSCFSPVMQWHSEPRGGQFEGGLGEGYNNDRSPWNLAEKWNDPEILEISCMFARLRHQLQPYLWQEAQYCAAHNRPMMAHLCLDYPEDEQAWQIDDEYMLGRELLVAPIVEHDVTERDVYLPAGTWTDYFTGIEYQGNQMIRCRLSLDQIAVFRKEV